jgi:hypothetical protein
LRRIAVHMTARNTILCCQRACIIGSKQIRFSIGALAWHLADPAAGGLVFEMPALVVAI